MRDERGMTLVELLAVMLIMSFVLMGITELYVSGVRAQAKLTASFNAQTALHVGMDKMRKDVHAACSQTAQSATSVTLSLPPCDGTNMVTWCTQASGSQYSLYRISGSSCSGGVKYAEFLTSGSIFTYLAPNITNTTPATGSYAVARLHVDMNLNAATPATAGENFRVVDDLAFRNSPRCTTGTNCPS